MAGYSPSDVTFQRHPLSPRAWFSSSSQAPHLQDNGWPTEHSDGAQVWSAAVKSIRSDTLHVQSGVVYYVLEEDNGLRVKSQARRTTDGKLRWSSDVLYTILAASSDTLYAVVSQMPGHSLIALNKLNGVKRWEFTEPTAGFVSAAVDSGGLYLCDQNAFPAPGYTPGTVYALDPNHGALHWKTTPRPGKCGKLAIGRTTVYSQVFQGIVALRQTDGSIA